MAKRPSWLLLVLSPLAYPQGNVLPTHESLTYSIEWRLITAGKATLDWTSTIGDGAQIKVKVESVGLVSKLFRVEDNYLATLTGGLCGQSVEFTGQEGSRE